MSNRPTQNGPSGSAKANTMNRKRVVFWMTIAVAITLLMITTIVLGTIPPWPVWLFFAISHGFFCVVVWRTPPYPGPHLKPIPDMKLPLQNSAADRN